MRLRMRPLIWKVISSLGELNEHHDQATENPMKTNTSLFRSLAAAVVLAFGTATHTSFAQTTATTIPVGFVTKTIPASPDGVSPGQLALSIPLYQTADFTGVVASIDSTTQFTLTGANFTFDASNDTHNPRLVRVKSGANVGLYINKITANTTTQLTVSTDISSILSVGDTIEVFPANTLGKVFGSYAFGTTIPVLATGLTATTTGTGNVFILLNKVWGTYYNNGTIWKKAGSPSAQDDTVITPDAGVFVVNYAQAAIPITLTGTIPSTTEETVFAGGGSTFIANRFPVDTTFDTLFGGATGSASLLLPGWVTGTPANGGDSVFAWNSAGNKWDTYYHNGSTWRKSGSPGNKGTDVIPAGTAVVVSRSAASAVGISFPLPYTP